MSKDTYVYMVPELEKDRLYSTEGAAKSAIRHEYNYWCRRLEWEQEFNASVPYRVTANLSRFPMKIVKYKLVEMCREAATWPPEEDL